MITIYNVLNIFDSLLNENEKLVHELTTQLQGAKEVVEAIKKGNIDAVVFVKDKSASLLVADTANQAYRMFIENMLEGVVTLNDDGVVLYSNLSFAKMVDTPLQKVIGANFRNFIPAAYLKEFENFFVKVGDSNTNAELSILNKYNIRRHFIMSLNRFVLHDIETLHLVLTDVTEQKKTEETLKTSNENLKKAMEEQLVSEKEIISLNNKLKNSIVILEEANIKLATFTHIATHDLQEPLRKIMTYSNMLLKGYDKNIDKAGQHFLKIMQTAAERMRNLINDILAYSELSKRGIAFSDVNLDEVVGEVISALEPQIQESKAIITIKESLPSIVADGYQMKKLFGNIIINALKFRKIDVIPEISINFEMKRGSEIEDVPESYKNKVFYLIYIRDNGIGFSMKHKDKIFVMFQKLNSHTLYSGTGIGLTICKKIVDQHNGFIKAESMVNKGSIFTIILPVTQNGSGAA